MTKARPIIMSAPMVQALLREIEQEGTGKTQTRRICKLSNARCNRTYAKNHNVDAIINGIELICPYGTVGDVLWVRETHLYHETETSDGDTCVKIVYQANEPDFKESYPSAKWKFSMYMPRWASRLTLEITDIDVERLQDISVKDCIAEGFKAITKDGGVTIKYGIPDTDGLPGTDNHGWEWQDWHIDPRMAYKKLWQSINGNGSWDANPWVWVIEFTPHLVNVDDFLRVAS